MKSRSERLRKEFDFFIFKNELTVVKLNDWDPVSSDPKDPPRISWASTQIPLLSAKTKVILDKIEINKIKYFTFIYQKIKQRINKTKE